MKSFYALKIELLRDSEDWNFRQFLDDVETLLLEILRSPQISAEESLDLVMATVAPYVRVQREMDAILGTGHAREMLDDIVERLHLGWTSAPVDRLGRPE